ncbi:prostatic acid phosphatase-like [Brevipalpus obovatus]|uniref:prostatic acid phosphatase-like n=1 Tax=Brevipalpus obovatus TaxID=246614 RepID=UPI003D9DBEC1
MYSSNRYSFSMCSILFVIPYLLSLILDNTVAQLSTDRQLELVIIAFRHADRTPFKFFAGDPYANESYWPDGDVQLLAAGKRRMYRFGRSLRARYNDFLTDSPREVYIRSSFKDRCIESAQMLFHGLYKAEKRWVYDNSTDFLPLPIHTVPSSQDRMLTTDSKCPEGDREKARLLHNDLSQEAMKNISHYLELIRNKTGVILDTPSSVSDYITCMQIERSQGLVLPSWMSDRFFEELNKVSDLSYYIAQSSDKILRLRLTYLFKDIKERIINKTVEQRTDPLKSRLVAYATHDSMIAAILIGLQSFNYVLPPYGSTVIIEVHKNSENQRFVHLFYWNDTESSEPLRLKQAYCNNSYECSVENFFTHLDTHIASDWERECGLGGCTSVWNDPFFLVLMALIILIVLVVALMFLKYRHNNVSREGYQQIPS